MAKTTHFIPEWAIRIVTVPSTRTEPDGLTDDGRERFKHVEDGGTYDHVMRFEMVRIGSVEDDPHRDFVLEGGGFTDDIDAAEVVCSATVKWDGCVDFDDYPSHFCGFREVASFAQALTEAYRLCAAAIPSRQAELQGVP